MVAKIKIFLGSPSGTLTICSGGFFVAWLLTPGKQIRFLIMGLMLELISVMVIGLVNKISGKVTAQKASYVFQAILLWAMITGIMDKNYYGISFGMLFLPALTLVLIQIQKGKIFRWNELLSDRKNN